jgi:hypothetical protein
MHGAAHRTLPSFLKASSRKPSSPSPRAASAMFGEWWRACLLSVPPLQVLVPTQPNPTRPETGRVLESYSSWPWPKVNAKPNRPWWGALCPPAPSPLTCACLLHLDPAALSPALHAGATCTLHCLLHLHALCIVYHVSRLEGGRACIGDDKYAILCLSAPILT